MWFELVYLLLFEPPEVENPTLIATCVGKAHTPRVGDIFKGSSLGAVVWIGLLYLF